MIFDMKCSASFRKVTWYDVTSGTAPNFFDFHLRTCTCMCLLSRQNKSKNKKDKDKKYQKTQLPSMVKRCVVGGCSNSNLSGATVHVLPSDPVVRKKWEKFVKRTRKGWSASSTSVVCGSHFQFDDFIGLEMWRAGYRIKLDLKKDAVPSIWHANESAVIAPASKKTRTSRAVDKRSVAKVGKNLWMDLWLWLYINKYFKSQNEMVVYFI